MINTNLTNYVRLDERSPDRTYTNIFILVNIINLYVVDQLVNCLVNWFDVFYLQVLVKMSFYPYDVKTFTEWKK